MKLAKSICPFGDFCNFAVLPNEEMAGSDHAVASRTAKKCGDRYKERKIYQPRIANEQCEDVTLRDMHDRSLVWLRLILIFV